MHRSGLKSSVETDYALGHRDAEVVIAGGCLLHDLGMSIHRVDHEVYSLHLAADILDRRYGKPKQKELDFSSPFAALQIWAEILGGGKKPELWCSEPSNIRCSNRCAKPVRPGRSFFDPT